MKTKYTPGPWNIQGDGILNHPVSNVPLKTCRFETTLGTFEVLDETNEPIYNARLISSAPEILEALNELRDLLRNSKVKFMICDGGRGNLGEHSLYHSAMNKADKAIRKATGE